MQAYIAGGTNSTHSTHQALAQLAKNPANHSPGWYPQIFPQFLLDETLYALEGRPEKLHAKLEQLKRKTVHVGKRLYYTASFLRGDISAEEFLEQPSKLFVESRLAFLQGLKADLAKNTSEAKKYYQQFLALPTYKHDDSVCRRIFAEWRIQQ